MKVIYAWNRLAVKFNYSISLLNSCFECRAICFIWNYHYAFVNRKIIMTDNSSVDRNILPCDADEAAFNLSILNQLYSYKLCSVDCGCKAYILIPSDKIASIFFDWWITWLLVKINPSGVNIKPEPLPPRLSCPSFFDMNTFMFTTARLAFSVAVVTANEYASRMLSS